MDLNGTVTNGHTEVNGKNHSQNGHHNGNGHSNGKDKFQNEYQVFQLGEKLTDEQKKFFEKNGFIHFKNFIPKEKVNELLQEAESIQNDWVSKGYKMINGVPIKYGTDVDGKKIVQRFAFINNIAKSLPAF
jgi:phytanoyl-CoA hydroxylase